MLKSNTQDARIVKSGIIVLIGIACQIVGVMLLMTRIIVPQFGLIAGGVWFFLIGIGLLLYATAPSRYHTKQDTGRKTPSTNRHKTVKPCPLHDGLCEFNLSCVHSGPCPLAFDHCPEVK